MEARIERTGTTVNSWVIGDDDEVIVIDPGDDAASVLALVGDREVLAVICTHGHATHTAAAVEVAARDEAPVALHHADRVYWREAHPSDNPHIDMEDGGIFEVADVPREVLPAPFVRTALAKGLTRRQILRGHVLRVVVPPVLTMAGMDVALFPNLFLRGEYEFVGLPIARMQMSLHNFRLGAGLKF